MISGLRLRTLILLISTTCHTAGRKIENNGAFLKTPCLASSLPNLCSVETLVDRLASAPCFRVSKPSPLQSTVKPGYTGVPCTGSLVIPDRNCDLAFFCMGIPESLFIMEYWTVLKSFCSSPVYLVEYNYDVTSL